VASVAAQNTVMDCSTHGGTTRWRHTSAALRATSVMKPTNSVRPSSTVNGSSKIGFRTTATTSEKTSVSPIVRGDNARRKRAQRERGAASASRPGDTTGGEEDMSPR